MQLFVIGTKRERKNSNVVKFRIIEAETQEVTELTPEELTKSIDDNEPVFKNIFKTQDKHKQPVYIFNIGVSSLPIVNIDNELVSKAEYVVISSNLDNTEFKVVSYSGFVTNMSKKEMEHLAEEGKIANVEVSKCGNREGAKIIRAIDIVSH